MAAVVPLISMNTVELSLSGRLPWMVRIPGDAPGAMSPLMAGIVAPVMSSVPTPLSNAPVLWKNSFPITRYPAATSKKPSLVNGTSTMEESGPFFSNIPELVRTPVPEMLAFAYAPNRASAPLSMKALFASRMFPCTHSTKSYN